MKKFRVLATAVAAAAFLAACGGNDAGDQSPRVAFTQMVNFGDSLSDVGTYKTQIVGINGGGHYSINGDLSADGLPYTNWTEYLAAQLQVPQPCAAEVGLESPQTPSPQGDPAPLYFLAQPPVDSTTCTSYAQGGSRVTDEHGPSNAYYWTQYGQTSGALGQITKPVVDQISTYLAANGNKFSDSQIITVFAGGNDLFIDRALLVDAQVQGILTAEQAGQISQADAATAIQAAATNAIAAMTQAGTDLAKLVTGQIIANGGTHVIVVDLPDVSLTPDNAIWISSPTTGAGPFVEPLHPHLTLDMTTAFNAALAAGLSVDAGTQRSSLPQVAWVDAFTASQQQAATPSAYGLTNVTVPACNLATGNAALPSNPGETGLTIPAGTSTPSFFVPLASSLFCTPTTLITDSANATATDPNGVFRYEYADTVHPTPYGYRLLAELVGEQLAIQGWL